MGYAMAAQGPGGAEVIRRIEIGEITPAAGEVVIEHEAIGVNFIDIYIRTGAYPWPVDRDLILGSEGAGTVTADEELGPDAFSAARVLLTVSKREGVTLSTRWCSASTLSWGGSPESVSATLQSSSRGSISSFRVLK